MACSLASLTVTMEMQRQPVFRLMSYVRSSRDEAQWIHKLASPLSYVVEGQMTGPESEDLFDETSIRCVTLSIGMLKVIPIRLRTLVANGHNGGSHSTAQGMS